MNLELETCSGISPPDAKDAIIAASASESVSNAFSFSNSRSSKRRSSIASRKRRQRRRSSVPEQHIQLLSSPMRRTKSYRYPERIRKHSLKAIHGTEKLSKRTTQVNTY